MYDYPNKYLWDIPRVWNIASQKLPLRPRIQDMPRPGRVDFDAIYDSPYGEQLVTAMKPFILYEDEMDPELIEYYRGLGLKKELFETENLYTKWSLYTPLSMYEKGNENRKYGLIFVLHGGCMPIHWEESTGWLPIAGKEELIVCSPQNHNSDNIMRILEIIKNKVNVDETRIYSTGYSQGGKKTEEVTMLHPEVFAAAAPCGCFFWNNEVDYNDELMKHMKEIELPFCLMAGMEESLEMLPATWDRTPGINVHGPDRHSMSGGDDPTRKTWDVDPTPATAHEKLELFRKRLESMNLPDISEEECMETLKSDNEAERNLGIRCENTCIREVLGVRHFEADYTNANGTNIFRVIGVEGQPHWPLATMPQLCWEFIKKYRRDPETKKLYVVE